VLHIAKSAIGAVSVPSNTVVFALSTALTFIAMAPVGADVGQRLEGKWNAPARDVGAWIQGVTESVREPLREFLDANSSTEEKTRFTELVKGRTPEARRAAVRGNDLLVLMPAFMITELLEAFALGFAIFLPFLVIDVVIANVLLATGVHSIPANQLGMPLKLLLFVTTDGWGLLAESLITSYV
jgi:type III secretion protein R